MIQERRSAQHCLGVLFGLLMLSGSLCGEDTTAAQPVALVPNGDQGFDFRTETILGTIQPQGAYHGVSRLAFADSQESVIDARYSALNLFKLMARNHYMGEPRAMERTVTAGGDFVEITWPPTEHHEAEIVARYVVAAPECVDVTVTVKSNATYPDYEVFVPNYFNKELIPHVFLKPARGLDTPEIVVPMVSETYRGTLLVFPRDLHAARLSIDGRWERTERGAAVVPTTPVRHFEKCLAFFTDAEKTYAVVVMADPRHCYGISTRYHADDPADRMTSYSAADFALFGENLLPGDVRIARMRLALTELDEEMSQPFEIYEEFVDTLEP